MDEQQTFAHRHAEVVRKFDRRGPCSPFCSVDHNEIRVDARFEHCFDHAHEFPRLAYAQL